MKKVIFVIPFLLFTLITSAQCEDLNFFTQLFSENFEKQNQLLEQKGFVIRENMGHQRGIDWANAKSDQFVSIRRDDTNKVARIEYRLKDNPTCYEKITSDLSLKKFKKEYETVDSFSTLVFFYASENFGLILNKWKTDTGNACSIELHSLSSYNKKLDKMKKSQ